MRRALLILLTALACAVLSLHLPASSAPAAVSTTAAEIRSVPVTFPVRNVNRTAVPCLADGRAYLLSGRLVGPAERLTRTSLPRVNLLVHDFTTGGWFWRLPGHPAYDYAARLAGLGEVSVAVDRLGYDASPLPSGTQTCLAAQADMVHQVVTQLRSGSYLSSGPRPRFAKVVTHGHSVGAAVTELEAATWRDVAGLVVMSWSDAGASPRALTEAALQSGVCLTGGDPAAGAPAYAYYGQSPADFGELLFATASSAVRQTATRLRNPDPCGDALALAPVVAANNALTRLIDVPVLLLAGERDALNRPDGILLQRLAYGLGAKVESHTLTDTGSALPLEASAPRTRALVRSWLCRSFGC